MINTDTDRPIRKTEKEMDDIMTDIWDYMFKPYSPFHKMGGECNMDVDDGIITITLMEEGIE